MLPEEAAATMLYIAWDMAHKAEKESGAKMRAITDKAWKAREDAEKTAEAARWRQKVAASPVITPEELKTMEDEVKFSEEKHELATLAEDETRLAMYECQEKFAEVKRLYAARDMVRVRLECEDTRT
jgi:hypothetical protein